MPLSNSLGILADIEKVFRFTIDNDDAKGSQVLSLLTTDSKLNQNNKNLLVALKDSIENN